MPAWLASLFAAIGSVVPAIVKLFSREPVPRPVTPDAPGYGKIEADEDAKIKAGKEGAPK